MKLKASKHSIEGFSTGVFSQAQCCACALVEKRRKDERKRSLCYSSMNDDVPVNYRAVHNTRDGAQQKPSMECHCCIFQCDSLSVSTVTEVQGLRICCAYDMWVTKVLSMEIWAG